MSNHRDSREAVDEASRFGKYSLIARLGQGGMAEAHLAMLQGNMGFQKLVVVKKMHASLGHDEHFVKMFVDEARLAARLNHPNVVSTQEVGEIDGQYFIAMEYLEGLSLDRIVRKYLADGAGVPMGLLLRVGTDALDGLHHAHELRDFDGRPLQVVHRDVTPSNLFVTLDGVAKVLDFGIAKATLQDEATRTGMLKGKLAYMAPEQFYPNPIDRRTDLWSMGVLLWEMTTGRRLFKGPNDAVTYKNIMGMALPSVRDFRRDAPLGLDAVLAKSLARDRDQRYATAEAMRQDLEAVIQAELSGATRNDVAGEMRQAFGEMLEENRRIIREFARPGARRPGLALGLSVTGELKPGGGQTLAPNQDALDVRSLGIAPIAPLGAEAAHEGTATDENDDEQFETLVNQRDGLASRTIRDMVAVIEPLASGQLPAVPRPVAAPERERNTRLDGSYDPDAFGDGPNAPTNPGAVEHRASAPDLDTLIEGRDALWQGAGLPPPVAPMAPSLSAVQGGQGGLGGLGGSQGPWSHAQAVGVAQGPQGAFYALPGAPTAMHAAGPAPGGAKGAWLGWLILLGLVGGLGALGYSQREALQSSFLALTGATPADPLSTGQFRIRVVSNPPSARVFEGDSVLGMTPLEMVLVRAEVRARPRRLTVRKEGYRDVVIEQGTSPHGLVVLQVNLVR
ncbi:MAG: serine/threonine protein kinase [Myxococcales bacterium]|nr:serine/threonine protein kinase [Myxococcales bacterium]